MKLYDDKAGGTDNSPAASPASTPAASAVTTPLRGGARGARRDPLRGLADVGPDATAEGAPGPSLWTRIKRAFQYGSQGGERR